MNLTRKILEGIQEVEFEINPEMQKHQGKKKGALGQVRAALKNNGWNVYNVVDLEAPEEGVRLSVWEHPNFTETIGIKWKDTRKVSGEIYAIELANNNLSVMTGDALSSKGLIQSMHPATPETVNKLTAEFKAEKDIEDEIGADDDPPGDFVLDADLLERMKAQDWISVVKDWGAEIDVKNPIVLMTDADWSEAPTGGEIEKALDELHADSVWAQSSNGFWMYPSYGQLHGDFMNDVAQMLDVLGA